MYMKGKRTPTCNEIIKFLLIFVGATADAAVANDGDDVVVFRG